MFVGLRIKAKNYSPQQKLKVITAITSRLSLWSFHCKRHFYCVCVKINAFLLEGEGRYIYAQKTVKVFSFNFILFTHLFSHSFFVKHNFVINYLSHMTAVREYE